MFRSCLNESLAHDNGTRTTRNPNLSIVTSSTFGYIIAKLTYTYTIYQNYNNENVTYGYNQFCSEYFAYDLATNSKYGSLPTCT
jgi:hypothetical protein